MPVKVMDAGGVLQTVARFGLWDGTKIVQALRIKVMDPDGVTLRTVATFAAPLSATAAPSPVTKTHLGTSGDNVTTAVVTVTPTGGIGPYTYAWSVLSYSSAISPTIAAPSNASTSFTQPAVDISETATFRCTVTDADGASVNVSLSATFNIIEL